MKLIIAEKPSVAMEIAKVVGATKREKGYFSGNDYMVSWCIGHLIELAQPEAYNQEWRMWNLDHLPIIPKEFQTEVQSSTAQQFRILKDLMFRREVTELIEATDAGREGELIFRLVYNQAGCKKPFKRLWISSVEEKSIRDGLATMKEGREYDLLYQAALCRQHADWLIGINLTRLYSKMYNKTLKAGRVQTPTLNLIVKRELEIENFVPRQYYTLVAELDSGFKAYKRVDDRQDAEHIRHKCAGRSAVISQLDQQKKTESPTALYDLTTLQRDANRFLGYSAQQTLNYMQMLYDSRLATYPRTDSRYLTSDMEDSTKKLIEALLQRSVFDDTTIGGYDVENISLKQVINNKKVTDHHAILPTMNVTGEKVMRLPEGERNILILIAYRLISAVYTSHSYQATRVMLDIQGEEFITTGIEIINQGFRKIEDQMKLVLKVKDEIDDSTDDGVLPAMEEGDLCQVVEIEVLERKTKPPKSYTEDTLLAAMETAGKNIEDEELREAIKNSGLGTPATRASIIENIINTGYVERQGKKLMPTNMAFIFIDLVAEKVKEPELTAKWEKELYEIQEGTLVSNSFMEGIISFVDSIVGEVKNNRIPDKVLFQEPGIGTCPFCQKSVREYKKSYSCESGKDNCGLTIWKTIAKKEITRVQAVKLITKGKTDLLKGFTSKTGKKFDAQLVLKKDKSIEFVFPQKRKS